MPHVAEPITQPGRSIIESLGTLVDAWSWVDRDPDGTPRLDRGRVAVERTPQAYERGYLLASENTPPPPYYVERAQRLGLRDPVGPDNWPEDYAWFDWWLQLWRVEPFGARTNPRGADRRVVFRMDPAVFQGIRVTVERWPGYDGPWESAGMIDIPPAHLWGTIPPNDQPFDYFDIDDAYPTPTGEIVGAVTPSGNAAVSVGAVPVQNADFNRGRSLVFHGGHDTRRIRLQASILGAWPQQGGPLNRTVLGRLNVRLVRRFGASTPAHWRSTLAYWRENVPADLRMQYEETPDDGRR